MKKSRKLFLPLLLMLTLMLLLSGCLDEATASDECEHEYGEWVTTKAATCTDEGKMVKTCDKCDKEKSKTIAALGHTEVIDKAIEPTCTLEGKTEGKHCSVCNTVTVAQMTVSAKGHTPTAVAGTLPTCTATGLTAGEKCSVCNTVLTQQTSIPETGHDYKSSITKEATCIEDGIKSITCSRCTYSDTEAFKLPSYTATEIYNQAVEYTGEIVTYKKDGSSYALGTCFVISSDGKVVTNYHVIDGAYSAKIYIKDKTYTVTQVLAYDKDIDLAILKINVSGHPFATVCKKSVNVGSTVYAIGSSRGLTDTFSQGIVTSMRTVDGVEHVQHDASITNGNSGGPLINIWGEVIGINTWGLANSQNLNFAVFTTELDNLKSTPMTMAQFYEKECNPRQRIINYVLANYDYKYESGAVEVEYDDSTYDFHYYIYYSEVSDILTIDLYCKFSDGDSMYIYMFIDEDNDYSYVAEYTFKSGSSFEMSGSINEATFTSNTLLGYSKYTGTSANLSSARELFSDGVILLLEWFEVYSASNGIDVTLADLGFTSFN